ncbi:MAG: cysteine methyltransferase [Candidatus Komeilibacteria bacterium CG10_big_fil_rev_8_21_14_0_10_41_13]|uniref:Cysteine methyltransferase n=1 Tax=Candidatus Komeilibacteria bacterium CG10_big_fil_rev_8_21_14_0_10_41_13 TaxID=1974476 RepID=A0A2M6WBY3_9BACT|nr:MAG: cysteine methyltransferase [Candidatus Komeilibacteria bacterium CG10_big_fil_rev_8_21_14_0_10_41_13]
MNFYEQVYQITKSIPKGKVSTYGQIAGLISSPRAARMVGWALHALDKLPDLPWQRVINSKGMISTTCEDHPKSQQAAILRQEGVVVEVRDGNYFVDLDKYLWQP